MQLEGIPLLILAFTVLYFGLKLFSFVKALAFNYPGTHIYLISPPHLNSLLPKIRGTSLGTNYFISEKHKLFESVGWDICTLVGILPTVATTLLVADATVIKEVTSSRVLFPKPLENSDYKALAFYGPNILVSEHDEWKKYRKISAPAFSERNNKLVWEETAKVMQSLFDDLWKGQDTISVDHFLDITFNIALFVIGAAGFGKRMSWKEEGAAVVPPGHTMSLNEALHVATHNFIIKLLVPGWAMGLTARFRKVKLGFEELRMYIAEMMRERELAVEKSERNDLLNNYLEANDLNTDQVALTESELISNIFLFLVAGHETTANSLCFAFALLALYPDEQEKLFEHVKSVAKGRPLTYADIPQLTHSMAVFNETLRMFTPAPGIPKVAAEDTTLVTSNIDGEKKTIPVPKGTHITIDASGVHYNPRYWKDPHTFNPSRFLAADWPRDALLSFSSGPRGCIGRRFAEIEAVAVLSILVSQFKFAIKEEPQFASETFEQRKARVLSSRYVMTETPIRVPLVFTRRKAT